MKVTVEYARYSGAGIKEWTQPSWTVIEEFLLANLVDDSGILEIELSADTEISIRGDSGLYLILVDCIGKYRKLLCSSADLSRPDDLVPMDDGESLRKDVIEDLHEGLKMLRAYFESAQFVDSEPYLWRDA